MIPILFASTETTFTSMGLGALADCLSCEVTEDLNGEFDLEMQYPMNGKLFDQIDLGAILLVAPNPVDDFQPFRIYKIQKSLDSTASVFARHISYDLLKLSVKNYISLPMNLYLLNLWCRNNCYPSGKNIFDLTEDSIFYEDDGTTERTIPVEYMKSPRIIRELIGDVIKLYNAEMSYDGYNVNFLHHRGANRGFVIQYGKNLLSMQQDVDQTDAVDGIVPYYVKNDGTVLYDDTDGHNPVKYVLPVTSPKNAKPHDFTADLNAYFEEHGWPVADVRDSYIRNQLANLATLWLTKNNPVFPVNGLTVEFVDLSKIAGGHIAATLQLGDTVTIRHPELQVETQLRVVRTVYDALLERYSSVDIGEFKQDVAQVTKNVDNTALSIANGGFSGDFINGKEINSPVLSGDSRINGYAIVFTENGAYMSGYVGAAKGSAGDETTTGIALSHDKNPGQISGSTAGHYVIVTSGGVRLQSGSCSLYINNSWGYLNGKAIAVQEE